MQVQIIDINDPRASQAEATLDAAHFPLPLSSRVAWGRNFGTSTHKLAIVLDESGQTITAVGLELMRTRSFPGHYILRVRAFGDAYATAGGSNLLSEIARYAVRHGRVLRAVVELECRTELARKALRYTFESLGFHRVYPDRIPERTLIIDLAQDEENILGYFNSSTRRKIRQATKKELEIVPLVDSIYNKRMNILLAETFARTGGHASDIEWEKIMAICCELPHRSRIVGAFLGSKHTPEKLLAYGWGIHHGKRVIYSTGASTRIPGMQLSLLYPVMWDLIVWAKREGATWFDLGGITPGSKSNDPQGGISDFKRGFSREEIALGEEWVYEPSAFKVWIARLVSNTAQRVRGLLQYSHRK